LTRRDPLLAVTALMAVLTAVFGAAMLLDPRTIDGAPAWLKPAKFAVSTGIYSATLVWVLRHLPDWPRLRRTAAATTAGVFVVEVALIAFQAARGSTSHFNTSSVLDGAIFSIMGTAIAVQTAVALAVAVALWRQPFADRARGWALRLGMTLAVIGASVGGMMTRPTAAQLAQVRETGSMPRAGAHTVGAPDGGPGLPGTGWSLEHGDLRVPHFVGLHAMQVLPLIVLVAARRVADRLRVRVALGAAVSYAALFAILLAQALLGQSVTSPDGPIAAAFGVWTIGTVGFALAVWRNGAKSTASPVTLDVLNGQHP
jgi:hypothetical protein